MIKLKPPVNPGDLCIVFGFRFGDGSIRNIGKAVLAVTEKKRGIWSCISADGERVLHGADIAGRLDIPETWLFPMANGLPAPHQPMAPVPFYPSYA